MSIPRSVRTPTAPGVPAIVAQLLRSNDNSFVEPALAAKDRIIAMYSMLLVNGSF